MGYIEFNQSNSLIKVSGGIIAFLVLTTICIIITASLWYFLQQKTEKQDQEEQKRLGAARGSNSEKNSEQAAECDGNIMTQQGEPPIYQQNDIEKGLGMGNSNVGMT